MLPSGTARTLGRTPSARAIWGPFSQTASRPVTSIAAAMSPPPPVVLRVVAFAATAVIAKVVVAAAAAAVHRATATMTAQWVHRI